ncbi:histidine phosphatase family protein [Gracilibacillus salinarum]|uniref:Histidine phosphatase family protein n=1 Tax=Gracilibacillus salinarum TaxID=2932255 RepID=A0ABY4GSE5_9BACI|nr:histidine phosphatase family protein [Gracilibacillus salinarum]UOQ86582.1 histidine phosphatase family protein [Gracilibacillus salinarum]
MAIYLVRHAKDDESFRGGWSQKGLINEGIQQATKIGKYLHENQKHFQIDRIISSDLTRARETAANIVESLPLPVEHAEEWREMNNGDLAGISNIEAGEKYPGLYFKSLRMDERYPGGESPIEFFNRIKQAFNETCEEQLEKNHKENVLIVTHGGVINIIYHLLNEKEWTNKNKSFPIFYTSIHQLEYINDQWEVTQENVMEHLSS